MKIADDIKTFMCLQIDKMFADVEKNFGTMEEQIKRARETGKADAIAKFTNYCRKALDSKDVTQPDDPETIRMAMQLLCKYADYHAKEGYKLPRQLEEQFKAGQEDAWRAATTMIEGALRGSHMQLIGKYPPVLADLINRFNVALTKVPKHEPR